MSYPLSVIPQFLEPFRTRSARSTGTCRGLLSRPTSRKYARWRPSLPGHPFSMADHPSANRVPLAEIHLRCTSAKEFRRKKLMRIKKGTCPAISPGVRKRRRISSRLESANRELLEKNQISIFLKIYSNHTSHTTTGINFRHVQIHFPRHRQRFTVFTHD